MFQGLSESQVKGAVEAMLFVTDEPVGALTLAKMLDCDPALVEDALSTLRDELAGSDRGIQLREAGVADTPGNPVLYATTRAFLEKFGLRSTADLPPLDDFAPDDETRRLITERLSATRDEAAITDEQARLMAEGLMYGDDAEDEAQGGLEGASALGDRPASSDDVRADASSAAGAQAAGSRSASPREAMFAEAIASTLGVVDKIDFDSLVFETEDE